MSSSPTEFCTRLFNPIDDHAEYADAVARFLAAPDPDSIPVWVDGRADLLSAMQLAAELYRGIAQPAAFAQGVLLGDPNSPPVYGP